MPMIQLKLSDDEYQYLLSMTGESTGIKAARYCISELPKFKSAYQAEYQARLDLRRELNTLEDRVVKFSRLLRYFEQFDDAS